MTGGPHATRVPEGPFAKITAVGTLVLIAGTVVLIVLAYLGVAVAVRWPPFGAPATGSSAWGVLWSGPVGITGNGLNFDDQPRPGSQSADIYYNGSLFSSSSAILAVWQQPQSPTAGQCQAWVTTHPGNSVSTLTAGMQICLQTGQGRPVLLHVHSVASQELDADATVWQQQ